MEEINSAALEAKLSNASLTQLKTLQEKVLQAKSSNISEKELQEPLLVLQTLKTKVKEKASIFFSDPPLELILYSVNTLELINE